ncbi:MAG: type II secretion system F family protein [Candidatus Brocadiia bacterium]
MPQFKYAAKKTDGKTANGTVTATNMAEATANLKKQGLTVMNINQIKVSGQKSIFASLLKPTPAKRASMEELVIFTRQLATMISAGIPLMESLEVLQEQTDNPGFKLVLAEVVEKVRGGSDFSAALADHPKVFYKIYVSMIKAGEAGGQLDSILARLAEYMEASQKLKREIKSAMTYPIISLSMIVLVVVGLLVFIIPKFKQIFESMGISMPLPTQILMAMSTIMREYFLVVFLVIAAFIIGVVLALKTKKGQYVFDWLTLKIPVMGELFKKVAISRFARTFSTLIKSGVPILGALEIVAATSGNILLENAINTAKDSVQKGESLSEPLSRSPIFPPMVTRMIGIGEKSGALEALLEKISEFYDQQVEALVDSLTAMIEPLMIGIMGAVVGGVVIAVLLPIFEIQKQVMNKKK